METLYTTRAFADAIAERLPGEWTIVPTMGDATPLEADGFNEVTSQILAGPANARLLVEMPRDGVIGVQPFVPSATNGVGWEPWRAPLRDAGGPVDLVCVLEAYSEGYDKDGVLTEKSVFLRRVQFNVAIDPMLAAEKVAKAFTDARGLMRGYEAELVDRAHIAETNAEFRARFRVHYRDLLERALVAMDSQNVVVHAGEVYHDGTQPGDFIWHWEESHMFQIGRRENGGFANVTIRQGRAEHPTPLVSVSVSDLVPEKAAALVEALAHIL